MSRALGVDIGTSGVRAAIVDEAKSVVAYAAEPFAPNKARDPSAWVAATEAALARLDLSGVGAIAIDGTSGTLVALDARGDPLAEGSMYNDEATPEDRAEAARAAPGHAAPTSPLARSPGLKRRLAPAKILHQADFVAFRLFGETFSDENNALKTGYDPVARRWPDFVAALGLGGLLPNVLPAGAVAARRDGRRIVAGTTDGCAAFLAAGAEEIGDGVTSLGSTIVLKLLLDKPIDDPATGVYSHRIGELWLAGGSSNSGGAALAQYFQPAELEALSARIDPSCPSGLDYYPLPRKGERFPVSDAERAPRLAPRPPDDALFLQGMLEAMAGIESEGYAKLTQLSGRTLRSLRAVGGGARNPAWTRLRALRIAAPFLSALSEHAAVGAALLALRASA
jgi:sugar (pentulose or hexulose) kinase